MTTAVVIPIKQLENAKQRLGSWLSASQRAEFFQAMVEDVLEAVTTCDRIDEVLIVSNDARVAEIARSYAVRLIAEPAEPGLINAVTCAGQMLRTEGVTTMMFLPGDVPLVTVEELEVVLDGFGQQEHAEFGIVPASDLGGSNCVVCSPPDCMAFGFGEDSFRRHLSIARTRGIEPLVAKLPGIGLDIDTAADVVVLAAELLRQNLKTHTQRFIESSGILENLPPELVNIG
ncbi:2-phospho-L-lactate guanylyltransferase [Pseudomonadales bacterium]|nr:2-phospho-L-lactate guanylyltransferase [Pseudomonadales bacterium]MDB4150863.1 2-phospho-L-lactate guanylyltransferase [Pseudomonadales bacterium]MDB9867042.1 2-phospho-L-lactate guanylyltransferase [Pseudomonadales bacterium]MDC1368056.1 2-phospho-L-lactate guanylyltransferase [Pseudomonadales bacterium]